MHHDELIRAAARIAFACAELRTAIEAHVGEIVLSKHGADPLADEALATAWRSASDQLMGAVHALDGGAIAVTPIIPAPPIEH